MNPEILAYPFLFLAVFFESFVLVTFLSEPARAVRARGRSAATPSVAIIVPCWDEEVTLEATMNSLLALEYPKDKLEIILVDDGSTDNTFSAMRQFAGNPQVRIIRKENGGKHTALNAGIATTSAELIGCLDADSFVEPDALREIVASFEDPSVMATTAAMSVHKPGNVLQHMQNAEYSFGIALRHVFATMNGLYVTPGPFSFYRRSVIEELGGFKSGYQAEDMEMALRIQKAGHHIGNALHARVYTKAPATVLALIKQRTRWVSGFLRNILGEYRGLIGNPRHGVLGVLVLPIALVAIGSSIMLFFVMLATLTQDAVAAVEIRAGIPLSYALVPQGSLAFDWFYIPASFYLLLTLIVVGGSLALMTVGRRISKTPGSIAFGAFSYVLLYGFLVPLWLIRSVSDVTFGRYRQWRA